MFKPKRTFLILLALILAGALSACNTQQNSQDSQQTAPVTQPSQVGDKLPEGSKGMPEEALFICQYSMNQVSVIDLATGKIVREIPVGAKPIALIKSPDNRLVYVANTGTGDVYAIDTASGEIDARISIGNQPVAMAINKKGDILYVLDYFFNRVSVVDLNLKAMTGFYELNTFGFQERMEPPDCCSGVFGEPMGAGRKPSALVLDEPNNKLYVGNLGTWDVAVIDLAEEREVEAFDAAFGINEMFLAGPDNSLYISAAGNEEEINDFILKLNLKGGGSSDKIKVGQKPVSMALAVDGRMIYVLTQNDGQLTGLSIPDGDIVGQCSVGGEPADIVLSEDGSKAFAADYLNGTVTIIDTRNYTVIKTIEAGITPKALVYIN